MELFRERIRIGIWAGRIVRLSIVGIILAIILVVGALSYFGVKLGWFSPEIFPKLPAQIFKPVTEEKVAKEPLPEIEIKIPKAEKKYLETAEWGEGITNLARRAVRNYLKENPKDFEVTPEHKIYIEDYLAKKMGGGWLNLGQTLEFSEDSIKEAIEKAETLTPEQLENLTQYSQLVSSLNY